MTNPGNNREQQNQDAYDDLIVSIEAGMGRLNLLIAVCNHTNFRQEIITRYQRELEPDIRCYHLKLPRQEPSLKAAIEQLFSKEEYLQQYQPAVITVTGVEQLHFLHLDESASEQEKFFGYLQWTREALRKFPFAIVLWVTPQVLINLIKKAPDFWSWRNGVFHFVSPPENVAQVQPVAHTINILESRDFFSLDNSESSGLSIADLTRLVAQLEEQENIDDVAQILNNLAGLYYSQGRYEEAETLFLEALVIIQQVFGDHHPTTVTVRQNLEKLRANLSNS